MAESIVHSIWRQIGSPKADKVVVEKGRQVSDYQLWLRKMWREFFVYVGVVKPSRSDFTKAKLVEFRAWLRAKFALPAEWY